MAHKQIPRFWYGYLDAREGGTIVLHDRLIQPPGEGAVLLYNSKRGELLEYAADIVRPKLRGLYADEFFIIDEVRAEYGEALSRYLGPLRSDRRFVPETWEPDYEDAPMDEQGGLASDPNYNHDNGLDPW